MTATTQVASDTLVLPQIAFGPHRLSRLIAGANTINGGSHLSRFVNLQMKRYSSPDQVMSFLADCQAQGISAWQSSPANLELYRRHREEGGQLQYISLAREDPKDADVLELLAGAGTIAVAHHGEVTDVMFKRGELERMAPFLSRIRDTGMMVGVSTHIPEVVDYVESKGWDVDFYMTCVYERHRTREELKAMLGYVPIPVREVYLEEDPPRMWKAMRQTERPCLAFKILAAGRLCDRQEWVEQAFADTFEQIKAHNAAIVGMYPEYEDQIRMNVDYVRRYGQMDR